MDEEATRESEALPLHWLGMELIDSSDDAM